MAGAGDGFPVSGPARGDSSLAVVVVADAEKAGCCVTTSTFEILLARSLRLRRPLRVPPPNRDKMWSSSMRFSFSNQYLVMVSVTTPGHYMQCVGEWITAHADIRN